MVKLNLRIFLDVKSLVILSDDSVNDMDDTIWGLEVGLDDGGDSGGARWGVVGEGHLKDG